MMAANGQVLYGPPSGRGILIIIIIIIIIRAFVRRTMSASELNLILRNSAVRLSVCPSVTYYWALASPVQKFV